MKAFISQNVGAAQLLSSNVVEDDESQWTAGNYAKKARVIENHIVYESLVDANGATPSVGVTTAVKTWAVVGVPNRWRMFDILRRSSLQTGKADEIVVELEPTTPINGLALFGLDANAVTVEIFDAIGVEVYNKTYSILKIENITNWYLFFNEYPEKEVRLSVLDLPNVVAARVKITIEKTNGIAKCGKCVVGRQLDLHTTKRQPKTTLIPTGVRKRDTFGELVWATGTVYRETAFSIQVPTDRLDYIERKLMALMAYPTVFVGSHKHVSMLMFGGIKGTPKSTLMSRFSNIDFVVEEI